MGAILWAAGERLGEGALYCMSDFVGDLVSDLVRDICMSDWVSQITMGDLVARFVCVGTFQHCLN